MSGKSKNDNVEKVDEDPKLINDKKVIEPSSNKSEVSSSGVEVRKRNVSDSSNGKVVVDYCLEMN